MEKQWLILLAVVLLITAVNPVSRPVSVTEASDALERDYWPTLGWLKSGPEEQGMNSAMLDEMVELIHNESIALDGVVVVRHGYVVLEEYPDDLYDGSWGHYLYSVTKSFTSALVGIALKEGFIESVEEKVLDFFPQRNFTNVDSRKEAMALEHVLTMTSGLQWDEWTTAYTDSRNDVRNMSRSPDWVQFVLDRPMVADPGTQWVYNSGGSHLLMAIVNESIGGNTLAFAREHLFDPLGISSVQWKSNSAGIPIGYSELSLRPLDMAKFGYLYLNNGTWDGEQILTEEWVAESTRTQFTPFPNTGYGYQWWIGDQTRGIYDARGMFGQRIIVIPEYDMVVVFVSSGTQREEELLYSFILPAVTDAPPIGEFDALVYVAVFLAASVAVAAISKAKTRRRLARRVGRGTVLATDAPQI